MLPRLKLGTPTVVLYYSVLICVHVPSAHAEIVSPDRAVIDAFPGTTSSFLLLLSDDRTPLFGYSMDIAFAGRDEFSGSVSGNVGLTNFYDGENVITAGGVARHPLFSEILASRDGGVFISTNTIDLSTILARAGTNDVLAQVFFDVSADAQGDFEMTLGPASALSGAGVNIPFSFETAVIHVVPEPGSLVLMALVALPFFRNRLKSFRRQA